MANIVYGRASDNVAVNATITVNTGTEDTAYPKANINNGDPASPAGLTGTSGSWVFDFGSAQSLDLVALIGHNIAAATSVTLQGNASNSWGGPTLSQAFTVPTWRGDGFSVSPFLDLSAIGSRSFRYWRVLVTSAAVAVQIGEVVMLATKRTLEVNPSWDATEDSEGHTVVEHRTSAGVSLVYDQGEVVRLFSGSMETTDAGRASLVALWQSTRGRARAFLCIPDPTINDAWFVRMADQQQTRGFRMLDSNVMQLRVEEVSKGLAP